MVLTKSSAILLPLLTVQFIWSSKFNRGSTTTPKSFSCVVFSNARVIPLSVLESVDGRVMALYPRVQVSSRVRIKWFFFLESVDGRGMTSYPRVQVSSRVRIEWFFFLESGDGRGMASYHRVQVSSRVRIE